MNDKEAWEKSDAAWFLRKLNMPFGHLQVPREFSSVPHVPLATGPDVKVRIEVASQPRRVGIELTQYYFDENRKGSLAWHKRNVRELLRSELNKFLAQYPELDRFKINVQFRIGEERLGSGDRRRIASELASYLGPKLGCVVEHKSFHDTLHQKPFAGFPTLQKYVGSADLYRNKGDYRGSSNWFASSALTCPGVRKDILCDLIYRHNPRRYHLDDVEECWLLIYTTGHAGSAARSLELERPHLSSQPVRDAVAQSGFARVYFWCRDFDWIALLG